MSLDKILQEPQDSLLGNLSLHHVIHVCGKFLPGFPSLYLHTVSNQKLEDGKVRYAGEKCGIFSHVSEGLRTASRTKVPGNLPHIPS